jgi:Fe2+ or Zn2+ uptake regulation protein
MSGEQNTSVPSVHSKLDEKSRVGKYFRKDYKKQKFAVCRLCQKAISMEYGNTTYLRKHVQNKYKLAFAELCKLAASCPSKRPRPQTTQCGEIDETPSTSKHKKLDQYLKEKSGCQLTNRKIALRN